MSIEESSVKGRLLILGKDNWPLLECLFLDYEDEGIIMAYSVPVQGVEGRAWGPIKDVSLMEGLLAYYNTFADRIVLEGMADEVKDMFTLNTIINTIDEDAKAEMWCKDAKVLKETLDLRDRMEKAGLPKELGEILVSS